jgi:hypothetical protein
MEKYYVYAYLREDRYSPYYIGKGSGFRDTNKRKLGLAQRPPDRDRIVRIKENLTEQEALSLEIELIRFWGKKIVVVYWLIRQMVEKVLLDQKEVKHRDRKLVCL